MCAHFTITRTITHTHADPHLHRRTTLTTRVQEEATYHYAFAVGVREYMASWRPADTRSITDSSYYASYALSPSLLHRSLTLCRYVTSYALSSTAPQHIRTKNTRTHTNKRTHTQSRSHAHIDTYAHSRRHTHILTPRPGTCSPRRLSRRLHSRRRSERSCSNT